jgi:hypothetical protein
MEAQIIARTSLRHKIINWQQTIDLMLWPFAHKAAAERPNSLTVNLHSSTHESIFIVFQSEYIPVTSFHKLSLVRVMIVDYKEQEELVHLYGNHARTLEFISNTSRLYRHYGACL